MAPSQNGFCSNTAIRWVPRHVYRDSLRPEGMVASAIEFGEVCRKHDFHNFIFSMKSSNPQVMVRGLVKHLQASPEVNAYRQLAREMYKLGWDRAFFLLF